MKLREVSLPSEWAKSRHGHHIWGLSQLCLGDGEGWRPKMLRPRWERERGCSIRSCRKMITSYLALINFLPGPFRKLQRPLEVTD